MKLYSEMSEICHTFSRLYFPHEEIASTIAKYLERYHCKKIVFFGALVQVARILADKGYDLTFVDYTNEMVDEAKKELPGVKCVVSDMRDLDVGKFDAIVLMGRILTYMHTDKDVIKAFTAFRRNLKPGGLLVMDNYETGKMDSTSYFTGSVQGREADHHINRISTVRQIQVKPTIYSWDCRYEDIKEGRKKIFVDENHTLRSFSREEIESLLSKAGFKLIEHAPNFEEISFVTVASC